jgi:hypothetical protein
MTAKRLIAALATAGLALAASGESKAAPLIVDDDQRYVSIMEGRPSGGPGAVHLSASNYGTAQFDAVLDPTAGGCCAHAEQHSSLLPTGFSGTGNISAGGFNADAENRFEVAFEVADVTAFQLDGFITGDLRQGYWGDANGLHTLDGPFSISGVLEPGVLYALHLFVASASPDNPSSGQWQLTLAVPEPALALLPLLAFGALALTRRRESLGRPQPLPVELRAGR